MKPDDPELSAALAAVAEGPSDDGAKRVLADLLLERGDVRGEFLLLQFLIAENQASGALRQRAEALWRLHKRAWLAGTEKVLCQVVLERGFPVEAQLRPDAGKHLAQALRSPMMATLRSLSSPLQYGVQPDGAIVDAVCAPRLRHLRAVTLRASEELRGLVLRDASLRLDTLTVSRRGGVSAEDCAGLAAAPSLARLARFVFPTPFDQARERRWPQRPEILPPLAPHLEALSRHPRLESVIVSNEMAGELRRVPELAALWPRLRFKHLQLAGTIELSRGAGGTAVSLQNLDRAELLSVREALPRDTVRLHLAPRFTNKLDEKAELAAAFARFNPVFAL